MRIVGGTWRGRPLTAPSGRQTRPTADRVRETLFNILEHGKPDVAVEGARVLDVFAGSGALGFEALSRGAARAVFIDRDRAAEQVIRRNAGSLGVARDVVMFVLDAARLAPPPMKAGAPFDLAFLDPPYETGLMVPALGGLATRGWLAPGAAVCAEVGAKEPLQPPPGFETVDERTAGAARIVFLRWVA
jgi:16S rRNA (guanine966-N2)-methyltransferase